MAGTSTDFSGKTALITGGSRGLGRQIARALAAAGAKVAIAGRNGDDAAAAAAEIAAEHGVEAFGVAADVGQWDQCDALHQAVTERFGRIDVLVNNAGMSPVLGRLSRLTETAFDEIIAVNLKGLYRLSALTAERMVTDGGGAIVNISSTAAVLAPAAVAPYAAAKAGVNTLTKAMARAYGPKVRVNAIMCGPFRTDLTSAWIDSAPFQEQVQRTTPLKRVGDAPEVVGAALYLAGPAASFTSGAILTIDGGES